jgi:hypothetical protein
MKKLIKLLPAMAILVGGGLALAMTTPELTPQYGYYQGVWEPISPTYSCSAPFSSDCTATDIIDGVPQNVAEGTYQR